MTHAELETAYIALCDTVLQDTQKIAGLCLAGRTDAAGRATVDLMDTAANAKEQYAMQQEQAADAYNLTTLRVDATTPSNSETGWERED
jgi:hypothetical protein